MKAWQKKLGVTADGIFGAASMKAWQKYLNSNSKAVYPPSPKPRAKWKVIDVSDWQDKIDWKKVKADGVVGAIIRYADGDYLDKRFQENMKNAKAAGVHVGSYIFSRAKTKVEAEKEASRLYNACKVYSPDMPLYIDLEDAKLSKYANTVAEAFCKKMVALGGKPGIYANLNWWNNYLTVSKYKAYALWIAQYNDKMTHKNPSLFGMWQYTSKGSVKGISGRVDMDWCYVEYWKDAPKPTPTPTPTPSKKTYDGSYPTIAEIKSASNVGTGRRIVAWCKQICDSGEYKYKVFTDDPKTQQCPICHNLSVKYKGWNCIGFSWAAWRHGGGIPSKCNCEVINDNKGNQLIRASSDAEATKMVQKCAGITDLKVIRNKNGIPESALTLGDIILYYDGNEYEHSLVYVGDGKVADSGRGHTPQVMFGGTYKKNKCKVAIQYTGGNSYLQRLDKGKGVRKIKDYLEWYDTKTKLADDDVFGDGTLKAVKAFQKKENITVDGLVGQATIAAMKKVKK